MPMNDWKTVYRNLNPKEPLAANDPRLERALYTNEFFQHVKDELELNSHTNFKLLISGHTGCGKSTFLNLVAADPEVSGRFHLIKYSVKELLDVNDVDYVDLLLSIAAQAVTSMDESRLKAIAPLLEKAESLARQMQGIIEVKREKAETAVGALGGETNLGIGFFDFLKSSFFARFRFEDKVRKITRETYRTRITELLSLIDGILLELRGQLGKPLLILIDDTDKIPPEVGLKLFYDNGHHLAAPQANIVYLIDLSIATSPKFAAIRGKFGAESFFPAIKVVNKAGGEDETARNNCAILSELVRLRVPPEIMEDDTVQRAICYFGGVVRELVRILQYAVFEAKGKAMRIHVDAARHRIANEFNLFGRHTRILKAILADPDWLAKATDEEKLDETLLDLLHMPALFQYRNGDIKWYRPYPVFTDWLRTL